MTTQLPASPDARNNLLIAAIALACGDALDGVQSLTIPAEAIKEAARYRLIHTTTDGEGNVTVVFKGEEGKDAQQ